jgi:SPP1 gp7 family putative phage head morphogenesis protein
VPDQTSEVVQVIAQFKTALARRDAVQVAEMVRRWTAVDQALTGQIEGLARELAELKAAGKSVAQWKIARMGRYQDLLAQMRFEMTGYARYAAEIIASEQLYYGITGIAEARAALSAITGRLGTSFNLLPVSAIHSMVGLAGNGSPLLKLLSDSWPLASQELTQALITGTSLGWNPRKTAKAMQESMDGEGLGRAVTIARTEQLRVYRSASQDSYTASGRIDYVKRLAARQERTCLACLADDGHVYRLDEPHGDHVSGRCTFVPHVRGYDEPTWTTGGEWLAGLDEDKQREIMGNKRFEAWKDGTPLADFVSRTHDKTWGASIGIK